MFHFARRRDAGGKASTGRRGPRSPITIGFEQLEGREMLSSGVVLTIIPTESRPLMSMPRPCIGSFNPEASTGLTVSITPRDEPDEPRTFRLWPLGGRFRME
jgi:hypothetical protein